MSAVETSYNNFRGLKNLQAIKPELELKSSKMVIQNNMFYLRYVPLIRGRPLSR
jgi:hypothetical protein